MNRIASSVNQPRQIRGLFLLVGLFGIVSTLSNWILTGSTQGDHRGPQRGTPAR